MICIHFLRNEVISKTLYLCKRVETFGSGLRKIYSLCDSANIDISYVDADTDFTIEFSRIDRNNIPEVVDKCGKSIRTVNRVISSLKSKKLIERIGSNKTGYWKVV